MKKCSKCKVESKNFGLDRSSKDKLKSQCKSCINRQTKEYRMSKKGLISKIYCHQLETSRKRNHKMPLYNLEALRKWCLSQSIFHTLYEDWVLSDYDKMMRPSCDRLDDDNGYSFDNIQLMTWADNKQKGHNDIRSGKSIHGVNPQKPVIQLCLQGNEIAEFHSMQEAERRTGIRQGSISYCCRGHKNYPHAGGFIWKFKYNQ